MTDPATTGTLQLNRVLRAPAERVYRAFLDAAALCKWLPPDGFTCTIDHIDAREGGGYHAVFTNFQTGQGHGFTARFVELVPNALLRYTDRFDDPGLPGEMQVSVRLTPNVIGTEVEIVQAGIPAVIPIAACMHGWQESLNQLAALVQHEVAAP